MKQIVPLHSVSLLMRGSAAGALAALRPKYMLWPPQVWAW